MFNSNLAQASLRNPRRPLASSSNSRCRSVCDGGCGSCPTATGSVDAEGLAVAAASDTGGSVSGESWLEQPANNSPAIGKVMKPITLCLVLPINLLPHLV